jgi:NAD(P)H-dependent FMN reductase
LNQDIEFPAPEAVLRVRKEVESSDGIWIVTPEYNYSYPGALKNLLDWLSRPHKPNDYANGTSATGKKVTISGVAGKSAAAGSRGKLKELLEALGMQVMDLQTGVSINSEAWTSDELTLSEEVKQNLHEQAEQFIDFI